MTARLSPLAGRPVPQGELGSGFVFLDLESSGLQEGSFPIEVGVSDELLRAEAWLIAPDPSWRDWSAEAEGVHGLSLERLRAEGQGPREVAEALSGWVGARKAVSDMPAYDQGWLDRLYAAAGLRRPFRVIDLYEALEHGYDPTEADAYVNRVMAFDEACSETAKVYPHTHRAGEDARCLAAAWRATLDPSFRLAILSAS